MLILNVSCQESQSKLKLADLNLKKTWNTLKKHSLIKSKKYLIVNKEDKLIYLCRGEEVLNTFRITIGEEPGNKLSSGDNRTPEGIFLIESIENSENWVYDDGDTTGGIPGAYGPWFIRLKVPGFKGIGIHGFMHDDHLGKRASHGCIRLNNEELITLKEYVEPGIPVLILPGSEDIKANKLNN